MGNIMLDVHDDISRLTLRLLLEAEGHAMVEREPDVILTDRVERGPAYAAQRPTLVLASYSQLPQAVGALKHGVAGYILLPLQPGEAEIMVRRALDGAVCASVGDAPAQRIPTLAEVEAKHIRDVLRQCRGNRTEAARLLGIGRNTLWRKLRQIEGAHPERATHGDSNAD